MGLVLRAILQYIPYCTDDNVIGCTGMWL